MTVSTHIRQTSKPTILLHFMINFLCVNYTSFITYTSNTYFKHTILSRFMIRFLSVNYTTSNAIIKMLLCQLRTRKKVI